MTPLDTQSKLRFRRIISCHLVTWVALSPIQRLMPRHLPTCTPQALHAGSSMNVNDRGKLHASHVIADDDGVSAGGGAEPDSKRRRTDSSYNSSAAFALTIDSSDGDSNPDSNAGSSDDGDGDEDGDDNNDDGDGDDDDDDDDDDIVTPRSHQLDLQRIDSMDDDDDSQNETDEENTFTDGGTVDTALAADLPSITSSVLSSTSANNSDSSSAGGGGGGGGGGSGGGAGSQFSVGQAVQSIGTSNANQQWAEYYLAKVTAVNGEGTADLTYDLLYDDDGSKVSLNTLHTGPSVCMPEYTPPLKVSLAIRRVCDIMCVLSVLQF